MNGLPTFFTTVILLATPNFYGPVDANADEPSIVKICKYQAKEKELFGAKRAAFIKECLGGHSAVSLVQKNANRVCVIDVTAKSPMVDESQTFMASCLEPQ